MRKPLQGVRNIIRFNWHFYVIALVCVGGALIVRGVLDAPLMNVVDVGLFVVATLSSLSLLVSMYVYDYSCLYTTSWLDQIEIVSADSIVSVTAGFDEFSELLKHRYSNAEFSLFDVYDPKRHKEMSIRRARKAYPLSTDAQRISTRHIPLQSNSVDVVFVILSAHEIRAEEERSALFQEFRRILARAGRIIVVEHLRDVANAIAYNVGALHFHSRRAWKRSFDAANIQIAQELKITPFITIFVLG